MPMRSLFRRLHGSPARSHLFCRTPLARTLRCEQLEDRRLLAQLTVNTDQDVVDLTDNVTSLREAVFAANIVPGADEIVFDFGHDRPTTILLREGELQISDSLSITGPAGALLIIDASGNDPTPNENNGDGSRVFNIVNHAATSPFQVTLEGLTLTGGDSSTLGGAILATESLFLQNVVISGNSAVDGGGIHASQVEIVDSIISGNVARSMGGRDPNGGYGGGINADDIVLTRSTVQGNTGRLGGGIFGGNMTIASSLVGSNQGGGISQSGQLLVSNSAIVNNGGSGIFMQLSTGTIHNSTISGNAFRGVHAQGGLISIEHCTITNNRATFGNTSGVFATGLDGQVTVRSSIIAGNPEGDVGTLTTQNNFTSEGYNLIGNGNGTAAFIQPGDQVGVTNPMLASLANNGGPTPTHALLLGSRALNAGDFEAAGGLDGVPEFDQRGEPFRRISRGRIDIGAYELQLPEGGLVVDTLADENDGDYTPGDLSLREAIAIANPIAGVDSIEFDPALSGGTIYLTLAELVITDSVNVVGLGAELLTIDNSRTQGPIFNIDVASPSLIQVSISGVTLTGSRNSAIRSVEDLTVDSVVIRGNEGSLAGGIRVERDGQQAQNARLTVRNSLITDNRATVGSSFSAGGIMFVGRSGALEITNSTVTANQAVAGTGGVTAGGFDNMVHIADTLVEGNSGRQGGGMWIADDNRQLALLERITVRNNISTGAGGGLLFSHKAVEIVDSTVTGNRTVTTPDGNTGGGIFKTGGDAFTIRRTTISDNHTSGTGGGISLQNSPLLMFESTVSNNSATISGGGINGASSQVTIERSTVAGNSTQGSGGGLSLRSGSLVIKDSTFSQNHADKSGGGVSVASPGARITNSTLSNNTAGLSGGGIASSASLTVAHSTITNNTADSNVDGVGAGGGIHAEGAVPNVLNHTIVAGNFAPSGTASDVSGSLTSTFSLIGVGAEFLAPLADNGGPTPTHALLPGSPAINSGDPTLVGGVNGTPEFDQRGAPFSRVFATRIDIGAYERQSFVVDTLVDEMDGNYGSGDLSLREAIALVTSRPGHDTIEFSPVLFEAGPATIHLSIIGGQISEFGPTALLIRDDLSLLGPGADLLTIDAAGLDVTPGVPDWGGTRIFGVTNFSSRTKIDVHIEGLTLTGADSYWGGSGIMSFENLSLADVHFVGNFARFWGAGLWVYEGAAEVQRSLFSGNATLGRGGGIATGFFMHNRPTSLTISDSTIDGNQAVYEGGGIYAQRSELTVRNCTITNNTLAEGVGTVADGLGGGIHSEIGVTRILDSLIQGNRAQDGAGINVEGGTVEVHNTTVSGNTADGVTGGIFVNRGAVRVYSSTIAFNESLLEEAQGVGIRGASATVENSIIWGNVDAGGHASDLHNVSDVNYSLVGQISPPSSASEGTGNLIGVDPLLGPLADNGGPTLTHALLAGSPAINAGEPTLVGGVDGTPEFDQRGEPFTRVSRGRIDIGAFEAQLPEGDTFVVDTLVDENDGDFSAGDFSLREAIALANQLPATQMIEFDTSLAGGTILMEHGELVITDALEVNGLGAELLAIDAQQMSRILNITATTGDFAFSGMTLTNGFTSTAGAESSGGGIRSLSFGLVSFTDVWFVENRTFGNSANGGAVFATGSLQIQDCAFLENSTAGSFAGGGAVYTKSTLSVDRSLFSGNQTSGGNSPGGAIENFGLTLTNSEVTGNQTSGTSSSGGGIQIGASRSGITSLISDSTVADNYTLGNSASGGGINAGGSTAIHRSTIKGNYTVGSSSRGGGINAFVAVITDSLIENNRTYGSNAPGGGAAGGPFRPPGWQITGTTFSGNMTFGSGSMGGAVAITSGLSITNGNLHDNSAYLASGGAISTSNGSLSVISTNLTNNLAGSAGGAIFAQGDASLVDSALDDNRSMGNFQPGGGGAVYQDGGSMLNILRSKITNNESIGQNAAGGGIRTQAQTTITDSEISGNRVIGQGTRGGGLFSQGLTTIIDSTLSGNHIIGAGGRGGAALVMAATSVLNSTISGNQITGDQARGGGLYTTGLLNMRHATVTQNRVNGTGGSVGGVHIGQSQTVISHSIIAGNFASQSADIPQAGGYLQLSYSLIGTSAGGSPMPAPVGSPDPNGNVIGTPSNPINPLLAPLVDNGGPTLTHALLPGSPAINAGDPTARPGVNGFPEFDQRGAPFARFDNGLYIDIGAFEYQAAHGSLSGDFDGDGDVDGRDFLIWQRGYGGTFADPYFHGDATRDGDIDGHDLEVWQATYGRVSELSALSDQLSESQELRADHFVVLGREQESGSRLWSLDSRLPMSLAASRPETASGDDAVFDDQYVEQADRAFDDWRPVERNRFDFGDIVTRRSVRPRLLAATRLI